jgi:hypothetical protein
MRQICILLALVVSAGSFRAAEMLSLPPRPTGALTGSALATNLAQFDLKARESEVLRQARLGNVPELLRTLCPISITNTLAGRTRVATFFVTPDYFSLGSDEDYLRMPISPGAGQALADSLGCTLPTPQMVDAIYGAARLKLSPAPIPPGAGMTTVPCFRLHNAMVQTQLVAVAGRSPRTLTAGHKKDVVVTPKLAANPGKVAIYGWHRTNGQPIQPLYLGHTANWVDYSQCTRLVLNKALLDGRETTVHAILGDPDLCGLLSNEGVLREPAYSTLAAAPSPREAEFGAPRFEPGPMPQERTLQMTFDPQVRILVNAPAEGLMPADKKLLLVLYALPNGNTIEWTLGRKTQPGDDWHYGIQHIAAQTRFIRERLTNQVVVVALLETSQKSWPAWRKQHGDASIPQVVQTIKDLFPQRKIALALNGHSGGGSFIFGYINSLSAIPSNVARIAFLDSNYAYAPELGHDRKLAAWLKGDETRVLCVLAYNDSIARLEGKAFVSESGGTWGRSQAMLKDLAQAFRWVATTNGPVESYSALDGRVRFLLHENPERKILHTVQVERNGFIHSLLLGTSAESRDYQYLGERAYESFIR